MLLFGSLSPWSRAGRLRELAEVMSDIGFEEIVVFWPWNDDELAVFEHDAPEIMTLSG